MSASDVEWAGGIVIQQLTQSSDVYDQSLPVLTRRLQINDSIRLVAVTSNFCRHVRS